MRARSCKHGTSDTVGAMSAEPALIAVHRRGERSALSALFSASPLRLLAPRNHGHAAWVYAASLGGGLVDGDAIDLRANVAEDAWLVLATQASTKVYRSSARGTTHTLACDVASRGALVCIPDPVVPFAGARYVQRSTLRLARDASLVWLDGVTCGRRLSDERWKFAHYSARTNIERDGEVVVRDHTVLDPAHGALAERMGRHGALATLIVLGPAFEGLARAIVSRAPRPTADLVASASPIDCGVVVRAAGSSAEIVSRAIASLLESLPALLGDDPSSRRW